MAVGETLLRFRHCAHMTLAIDASADYGLSWNDHSMGPDDIFSFDTITVSSGTLV